MWRLENTKQFHVKTIRKLKLKRVSSNFIRSIDLVLNYLLVFCFALFTGHSVYKIRSKYTN